VLDAPELPDAEYDRLFQRLQALEARTPRCARPIRPPSACWAGAGRFTPVRHAVPMLSIRTETDTTAGGAEAFDARVRRELAWPRRRRPSSTPPS
jgi:DNA ligase (NAD+)